MLQQEIQDHIQRWRFAFRRGDTFGMDDADANLTTMAAGDRGLIDEIETAKWVDKPGETLLDPAPEASLIEAVGQGWRYRIIGVPVGVENGALVMGFDVFLASPSGTLFDRRGASRSDAVRAALDAAGIAY
jgi:hypothetical protein